MSSSSTTQSSKTLSPSQYKSFTPGQWVTQLPWPGVVFCAACHVAGSYAERVLKENSPDHDGQGLGYCLQNQTVVSWAVLTLSDFYYLWETYDVRLFSCLSSVGWGPVDGLVVVNDPGQIDHAGLAIPGLAAVVAPGSILVVLQTAFFDVLYTVVSPNILLSAFWTRT